MSSFCYGILLGIESEEAQKECIEQLEKCAKNSNIGIQFSDFYIEPFIANYYQHVSLLVWNFSDNASTINCEHLLCPDWCNSDSSRCSLESRLNMILTALSSVSAYGKLEVWMGTSGDELCDIESIQCMLHSFVPLLINAYHNDLDIPSIHVSII